jgi:plasmid stabilization system protein ParE
MARKRSAVSKRRARPAFVADYILASCVEAELDEIWEHIAKDNPEAATRVVAGAFNTFKSLAADPGLGHPRSFQRKAHLNVRVRAVEGFDKYLIVYRETKSGIDVLHVYHTARNISALLRKR